VRSQLKTVLRDGLKKASRSLPGCETYDDLVSEMMTKIAGDSDTRKVAANFSVTDYFLKLTKNKEACRCCETFVSLNSYQAVESHPAFLSLANKADLACSCNMPHDGADAGMIDEDEIDWACMFHDESRNLTLDDLLWTIADWVFGEVDLNVVRLQKSNCV
jgi:hypothetical protein